MEQILIQQKICFDRLQEHSVKFVGIVNSKGRLVEGGFKNGVTPFLTKERVEMLCMELSLDYSMRREFDDSLGKIQSIVSIREDTIVTTTPLNDHLLIEISDIRVGTNKLLGPNEIKNDVTFITK